MATEFSCSCGKTAWKVADRASPMRVACHCADCQAFARYLGKPDLLDASGGSDLAAVRPSALEITKGAGNIRPLRLSPRGLFRWHTTCCNTPVANTPPSPRVAYVGLFTAPAATKQEFGPLVARINTEGCQPPVQGFGGYKTLGRLMPRMVWERLSGGWKRNALFGPDHLPIAPAHVISLEDRARAYGGNRESGNA